MGYAYDFLGNITTLTYPDSSQIRYIFNAAGSPSRVVRKAAGASTYSDFVSNLDYGPHGQVVNTLFANGASTTKGFNANALHRLSSLQTLGAGSTYLQNFSYTYDSVGNFTQIANTASTSAAATTVFNYDQLNRLLRASTTAATSTPYQQNFTYDALGNILTLTNGATSSAATPSILDTLPLTIRQSASSVTSHSFAYIVPSGGTNKLLVAYGVLGSDRSSSVAATQNGAALTCRWLGTGTRAYHFICYLANPATGTFQLSWTGATNYEYTVLTLKDAAQSSPLDALNLNTLTSSGSSLTTSTTTSQGGDILLDVLIGSLSTTHTFGANQSETYMGTTGDIFGKTSLSTRAAGTSAGSESMSRSFSPNDNNDDLALYALKAASTLGTVATTTTYTYAGTGYANPDAVTSIGNGVSTTTYAYDNNGNLTQVGSTTYLYDYQNRITSIGFANSTSTFGYDGFGARVFQAATTSTTTYANKYFSISSTTVAGASWATTTAYVWLGDTLLGTVDRQFKTGAATGTAKTRYVHNDHLGSTNVVTDEGANLVQTIDYYPFGATRISSATSTNQKRKYIGQFADDSSGLDYLNARYYDSARGQFVSQEPIFLNIGDATQIKQLSNKNQDAFLADPQQLNSYNYGRNNPTGNKDPSGKYIEVSTGGTFLWLSGSIGVRLNGDLSGGVAFASGGAGYGIQGRLVSLSYSPGPVPRTTETTVVAGGDTAIFGASRSGTYVPGGNPMLDNARWSASLNYGVGYDWYLRKDVAVPIFGGLPPDGLALDSGSPFSTPNYVPAPRTTTFISSGSPSLRGYHRQNGNSFSIPGVPSGSSGSNSSSGAGGNAISTWLGAFNPFQPR